MTTALALETLLAWVVASGLPVSLKCSAGATRLAVEVERSAVRWRGTKFFGLGKHEGVAKLGSGELCMAGEELVGGSFSVDLTTIEVTDIALDDPVPRRRLREHLLGPDFFDTPNHPTARFVVTGAVRERRGLYRVTGDLTMRGRTNPVTFFARTEPASADGLRAVSRFSVDRHKWGVSFRGSTLRDDLVDDEFWLELEIEARRPAS